MERIRKGYINKTMRRYQKFLKAWARAGYPKNFRCNGDFQQIMDGPALREKLEMHALSHRDREQKILRRGNQARFRQLTS